ncbi:MAG TPA: glycosyltransferase family 1 protein, partial [Candidatus Moranbacteria bacterium]|nr:glycosyltransferase family 1 protein [Candidatus Moranbacteria bacterium]
MNNIISAKCGKNKKITIGINASFLRKPNTGIGQVTLNFLKKLSELKNEDCKFILYLEEELPKEIKLSESLFLPTGNFEKKIFLPLWKRDDLIRKIWWEKCLLPKHVKKDGCDVFFSLYQSPTIIKGETKHVMLVHDIIPKLFPEYLNNSRKRHYQKLIEKAILRADKIMAISRRTEKDLIQHLGLGPDKISVNYIDVDEIYKKEAEEKKLAKVLRKYKLKPGYILSGGGLEVRKNIEGVIRAYHYLTERNKNERFISEMPKLVVYGKLLPQLFPLVTDGEKLARELNLTKKIKFLDAVPQNDLPSIFQGARMFVYPSFYEGFGLPILESMNQGKPVITSKTSSL